MSPDFEPRAVELLVSRICHDLVSPVGAINNGVELIDEMGPGAGQEALTLIADSAEAAARRLRLFRFAFGAAGGHDGLDPAQARLTVEGWFRGGRVRVDWQADLPAPPPRGLLKLLLIAALLADEALPAGGTVRIVGEGAGLSLLCSGRNAGLREETRAALAGEIAPADLSARSILGYAALRFGHLHAIRIVAMTENADDIRISLVPAEV